MATANQTPTGRPWLLRLASQARIDQPQVPQPQPQPQSQPSLPVRPTAPPPPRGPPIRQASMGLGRPPLVISPAPTQPPAAALTQNTAPPPSRAASTNGTAVTTPPEAPRSAREALPAPPPPPPPPAASTNGTAVTIPAEAPRSARAASPAPPPPWAASTNGTAITTPAEAPRSARAPSPSPPPPSPRTTTRSSPTPPQSPRVVIPATSASSPGFSFSKPQPEPKPAVTAAEKDNRNGTKVLGNGAINGGNSFKQQNSTSPLTPPKNDEKSSAADGRGWAPTKIKNNIEKEMAGITIAGHNVGAFMDLGSSYSHQIRRQQYQHVHGKPEYEDVKKSSATATEFEAEAGDRKQKPSFSMVNSNVQSVNNSLLLNSVCVQGSPGVHVSVGRGWTRRQLKNGGDFSDQKKPSSASPR